MPFHEEWFIAHACLDKSHPVCAYIEPDNEGRLWLSLYSDDNRNGDGVMILNACLGDLKKVCQ